jgi:hypothetical protein
MRFLRSALHKLAQPLTAALWINELQSGHGGRDTQMVLQQLNLGNELERAVTMLNFLKELLEERQNMGACDLLSIREQIESVLAIHAAALPLAARVSRFAVSARLLCWGNALALQRLLGFVLEFLAAAAVADGPLEMNAQRRGEQVEIRFAVPSVRGEQLAAEFTRQANPFEGFPLTSRDLPEAARMLTLAEEMNGSLRAEGSTAAFTLVLGLRLAYRLPTTPLPTPLREITRALA